MMRTVLLRGGFPVANEVLDWLEENYPIKDAKDVPAFMNNNDWSIFGFSLRPTIEWYMTSTHTRHFQHSDVPVVLTAPEQLVMFKLRFGEKITMEY